MDEKEQLEWKIGETEQIMDALLNRGSASIRGVLSRRIQALKREKYLIEHPPVTVEQE